MAPSGGRPASVRLVAAALLFVVAALAVGGSFGQFWIVRSTKTEAPGLGETSTNSINGWWSSIDSQFAVPPLQPTQHGISLTIGALLAVAGAVMLILTARRADDPAAPRLVGVGAAAFLLGGIGAIWLDIIRDMAVNVAGFRVGVGGWVLLVAAVVALVAVGLLLTPGRSMPVGWPVAGAGPVVPYGSGDGGPPAYPPAPVGPPGWPPPGGSQGLPPPPDAPPPVR